MKSCKMIGRGQGRGESKEVVDKVRKVDNERGDDWGQAATESDGGVEGDANLGLLHSFGRSAFGLTGKLLEKIMVWCQGEGESNTP
jgi:hypothetical protein